MIRMPWMHKLESPKRRHSCLNPKTNDKTAIESLSLNQFRGQDTILKYTNINEKPHILSKKSSSCSIADSRKCISNSCNLKPQQNQTTKKYKKQMNQRPNFQHAATKPNTLHQKKFPIQVIESTQETLPWLARQGSL